MRKKVHLFAALYKLFIFAVVHCESLEIRSEWGGGRAESTPPRWVSQQPVLELSGRMYKSLLLDSSWTRCPGLYPLENKQQPTHCNQTPDNQKSRQWLPGEETASRRLRTSVIIEKKMLDSD